MGKFWVILAASLLAGCSNQACQPQSTASLDVAPAFLAEPLARPQAAPKIARPITKASLPWTANSARAEVPDAEADENDATASFPPEDDLETNIPKSSTKTDIMIKNPALFSAAEDRRPWPMTNSPEWAEQQKDDARRDKAIKRAIKICHC